MSFLSHHSHIRCSWWPSVYLLPGEIKPTWYNFPVGAYQNMLISRQSDAYMRQQTRLSLAQIMACPLFGPKLLSEPILTYLRLDHKEKTSARYQWKSKHFQENYWKCVNTSKPLFVCQHWYRMQLVIMVLCKSCVDVQVKVKLNEMIAFIKDQ